MKLIIATALAVVFAMPVFAAPNCGLRDTVIQQLSAKYSEQLTVGGLQKVRCIQTLMEIWASTETGTFTVLLTNPSGVSCIVAAGTDFFEVEPKPVSEEDPTWSQRQGLPQCPEKSVDCLNDRPIGYKLARPVKAGRNLLPSFRIVVATSSGEFRQAVFFGAGHYLPSGIKPSGRSTDWKRNDCICTFCRCGTRKSNGSHKFRGRNC